MSRSSSRAMLLLAAWWLGLSAGPAAAEGVAYVEQVGVARLAQMAREAGAAPSTAGSSFGQGANRGIVDQRGDDNRALQVQTGSNTAHLLQTGDANTASQMQWGAANKALLRQVGNSNEALQVQIGARNLSDVEQWGDDNRIDTLQVGTDNRIDTVQHGGEDVVLVQRGSGHSFVGVLGPGAAGLTMTQVGRSQDIVVRQK